MEFSDTILLNKEGYLLVKGIVFLFFFKKFFLF